MKILPLGRKSTRTQKLPRMSIWLWLYGRVGIRRLTWLAGLALIAVGILCLSLSGAVARTGTWWQGTWQALGVGFLVGGIVDVLAISLMSQYSSGIQRHWNDQASVIVYSAQTAKHGSNDYLQAAAQADWILRVNADVLDPGLRGELRPLADSFQKLLRERAEPAREGPAGPT